MLDGVMLQSSCKVFLLKSEDFNNYCYGIVNNLAGCMERCGDHWGHSGFPDKQRNIIIGVGVHLLKVSTMGSRMAWNSDRNGARCMNSMEKPAHSIEEQVQSLVPILHGVISFQPL